MEYEHIDADNLRQSALVAQARQTDQQAFAAQFEARRAQMMADAGEARYLAAVDQARLQADAFRKEADAFIEASNIDPQELVAQRQQFLVNLITNFETGHLQQEAIRSVKRDAGLPVADLDSQLVEFEVGKNLAEDMLKEFVGVNRQQRRATKKG